MFDPKSGHIPSQVQARTGGNQSMFLSLLSSLSKSNEKKMFLDKDFFKSSLNSTCLPKCDSKTRLLHLAVPTSPCLSSQDRGEESKEEQRCRRSVYAGLEVTKTQSQLSAWEMEFTCRPPTGSPPVPATDDNLTGLL